MEMMQGILCSTEFSIIQLALGEIGSTISNVIDQN